MLRHRLPILALAVVVTLSLAPSAGAEGPHAEELPSFGESPGCGALDGVGGPRMAYAGFQSDDQPVYGPWGTFFGRTIGDVRSQLVKVHLPGQPKDLWIHERLLPSFQQVLDNIAAYAPDGESYEIRSDTWSFHPVTIPPTTKLSFHGVGASIDVNSETNPYRSDNVLITDMPQWFVDAWRDAGWCWGGDWQTIKDPMHYSWMGPIHTPGYDMTLTLPQPPKVSYTAFEPGVQWDFAVNFVSAADGQPHFAADMDANGAADVVRLRTAGSGLVYLETSRSRHGYTTSVDWARTATAPSAPAAPVALADLSRDARDDLVYAVEQGDGTLDFEVFTFVQSRVLESSWIDTSVPVQPGDVYLFDDYDLDGHTDLYVIRPGDPGSIDVWSGPDFTTPAISVEATLPADSRYATGDRDVDGTADVFSISASGVLDIRTGATDFAAVGSIQTDLTDASERFFVDDLDGDGHSDLLLIAPDGDLRMRRGGYSTHDPAIWHRVDGEIVAAPAGPCPVGASCDSAVFIDVGGRWHRYAGLVDGASIDRFFFGNSGDVPFTGDWDGDGVRTPGLYRRSDGYVYLRDTNTQGVADREFFFGNPGDVPIVGDFDGDGDDTVSIYRPSQGRFYIINELGAAGGGLGNAEFSFEFGNPWDRPFVGDFDGDGVDTIGLHRASTGFVYLRNSLTSGAADIAFFYGNPGDLIVAGDWDGDGDDTVAVYRPSTGRFYISTSNVSGKAAYHLEVGQFVGVSPG